MHCLGFKYQIWLNQHLTKESYENYFFSDFNEHTTSLFSKAKILKFIDFSQMENCTFVNKSIVHLFENDHNIYNTRFV